MNLLCRSGRIWSTASVARRSRIPPHVPRVTARLLLVDRTVDLIEEGLDVSVRIEALPNSSLIATRVGSIRHITCASPAYLVSRGKPSSPQELRNHDCISFTALSPVERWSFAGAKPQRVNLHPRLTVDTAEAAIDAAVAGLGITRVLSYQAARPVADGSLRLILENFRARRDARQYLAQRGPLAAGQGSELHCFRSAAVTQSA